jgi:hypothetical protein
MTADAIRARINEQRLACLEWVGAVAGTPAPELTRRPPVRPLPRGARPCPAVQARSTRSALSVPRI